jgi:hypothetical protein
MRQSLKNGVLLVAVVVAVALAARGTDWAAWVTAVATTALAAGVLYAKDAVDDAKKTRHAQLVLEIDKLWNAAAMVEAGKLYGRYSDEKLAQLVDRMFDRYAEAATPEEVEDYEALAALANLIETTGAIMADGGLTEGVIYDVWGGPIAEVWTAWEKALPRMREHLGEPDLFRHFEDLGKAMVARLPEPGIRSDVPAASGRPDPPGGAAAVPGTSVSQSSDSPSVPDHTAGRTLGALAVAAGLGALSAVLLRRRNAS